MFDSIKRAVLVIGVAAASIAAAAPALAATPNNTAPPGGGGSCLIVSGTYGVSWTQSYTAHVTNYCGTGISVRAWIECNYTVPFEGVTSYTKKYGSTLTNVSGTSKASCDLTDSATGYGYQYRYPNGSWIQR